MGIRAHSFAYTKINELHWLQAPGSALGKAPIGRSPFPSPPQPPYCLLRRGLARARLVTPLHDCAPLLAGAPSIVLLNRQSPTSLRPAQAPRPTVSRVSDLLGVGARACASVSFKWANQRSRRPSRPLPLYFPFSATPSSRIPPRPPRTPIGRPAERPLPNFGLQLAGRERARRTPRAVRADVTGRGTARGAREGARPVGGYKRAAVRARQA